MTDVDNLHVSEINFKYGKSLGDLPRNPPGHPERLLGADDGDDDVVIVHDIVREHDAGDILGEPAEIPGKEKS